eukprot:5854172-Amphidinium_carterae.1
MTSGDNIRVYVRVRPPTDREVSVRCASCCQHACSSCRAGHELVGLARHSKRVSDLPSTIVA